MASYTELDFIEIAQTEQKSMAKKSSNVKRILIGCSSILLLVIASIIGLYFYIFSGPSAMAISEYHPFRSEKHEKNTLLYTMREKRLGLFLSKLKW